MYESAIQICCLQVRGAQIEGSAAAGATRDGFNRKTPKNEVLKLTLKMISFKTFLKTPKPIEYTSDTDQ